MTTVTNVQEGAGDILADAKAINDQRAATAEAEVVEDALRGVRARRRDCGISKHLQKSRHDLAAFPSLGGTY